MKITKILAGIITYLIALTLLLCVVVDAIARIIGLLLCVGLGGLVLVGIWWLICQLLESDTFTLPPG